MICRPPEGAAKSGTIRAKGCAYPFAGTGHDELKGFLARGGMLAWGCVPVFDDKLAKESVDSLVERLERGLQIMVDKGVDRALLAEASWITPCCATASMSPAMAERAFAYTSGYRGG